MAVDLAWEYAARQFDPPPVSPYLGQPVRWMTERRRAHLWSKQREIATSIVDHKRTAVKSCHNAGKCTSFDAVIQLMDGTTARAEELIGRCFVLPSWSQDGQQKPGIAWATDNGVKPLFRVSTTSGRSIDRTGNHPLWAARRIGGGSGRRLSVEPRGWTNIEDLAPGDLVLVPEKLEVEGRVRQADEDVKLLGYMLGDGSTTQYVGFTQKDGPAKDEFIELVEHYGCQVRAHPANKYGIVVVGPDGERFGRKDSNPVLDRIRSWGLFGCKAVDKRFPDWAWRLPNDQLALLLNRLFACDGWASVPTVKPGQRQGANVQIAIGLGSEGMIRDIELAMLRLGILGTVRARTTAYDDSGRRFRSWIWTATRLEDLRRFQELVGIYGKEDAVARAVATKESFGGRSRHWMRSQAPPGYRWESIVAIEALGEQPTVCISVAEHHTYVTTFVEHNSWIAAQIAAYWIDVHPPGEAFIVSTAPTYAQVHAILWEEIRKAAKNPGGDPLPGRVLQSDEWKLDDGTLVGWGRKPADNDAHGFQGIHRKYVLVILDEACHDAETEVMTEFGWRRFSELDGSERLLTMDPVSHAASYRTPDKIIAKPYRGKMFRYQAKGADFCVTPDHDMYFHGRNGRAQDTAWRKEPMAVLAAKTNKYMKKTVTWVAEDTETFTLPEWSGPRKAFPARTVSMDHWMEFLGWYLSEGHLIRNGRPYTTGVGISQKDPAVLEEIHQLCLSLGFNARLHPSQVLIHNTQLARHLEQYGSNCLNKTVPPYARMASTRQMNLLLDAYVRGDGYRKGKGDILYTSSKAMADALQEMILKTGRPSVLRKRPLEGRTADFGTHIATSSVDGYVVTRPHEDSKIKYYPSNVREIDYDGMVYCARVSPEHLLFTRRNGYSMWSGNCGIPEQLWTAVEAITTTDTCRILAIGNPDDPNTEFGNVCKPGSGWNVIRISGLDTPNFTGEPVPDAVRDLMLSPEWVEDKRRRWGENSPRFVAKCLGEFPEIGDDTLISPRWIEAAQARALEPGPRTTLGVDVARFGSDSTILALGRGPIARVVAEYSKLRTTETTGHVIAAKREHAVDEIRVDGVGVGAGVVDELLEAGHDVVDMQSGAAALDSEHYANARAEWWWGLRERFEQGDIDIDPDDDELAAQLGAMKYKYTARGQVLIESKDEMKKRGLPSPDRADAVMLTYARIPPPDQVVEDEDLDDEVEGYSISDY